MVDLPKSLWTYDNQGHKADSIASFNKNRNNNNILSACNLPQIGQTHRSGVYQSNSDISHRPVSGVKNLLDTKHSLLLDVSPDESKDRKEVICKRFVCEHCCKSFSDPSNLQRHIRHTHNGARAHPCPECGKTFGTSSGLKQHQHIHSSVKPFTCEVCRKSYTQFSNLCRHKRMHANCRVRVKCESCDEVFSSSSALNKHRRFCEEKSKLAGRKAHTKTNVLPVQTEFIARKRYDAATLLSSNNSSNPCGSAKLVTPFNLEVNDGMLDRVSKNVRRLASYLFPFPPFPIENGTAKDTNKKAEEIREQLQCHRDCFLREAPTNTMISVQSRCNDPADDSLKIHTDTNSEVIIDSSNRYRTVEKNTTYLPHDGHRNSQIESQMFSKHLPSIKDQKIIQNSLSFDDNETPNKEYKCAENSGVDATTAISSTCTTAVCGNDNTTSTPNEIFCKVMAEIATRQRFLSLASALKETSCILPTDPIVYSYVGGDGLPSGTPDIEQPLDLSSGSSRTGETDLKRFVPDSPLSANADKMPRLIRHMQGFQPNNKNWMNHNSVLLGSGQPAMGCHWEVSDRLKPYKYMESQYFLEQINDSMKLTKEYKGPLSHLLPLHTLMQHSLRKFPNDMFGLIHQRNPPYNVEGRGFFVKDQFRHIDVDVPSLQIPCIPFAQKSVNKLITRINGRCDRDKYLCKYCGKIFPRSANLTRHLRTHTGEQPYSCPYCERNFSISSNLQRHVRNIHKKERPYTCPICKRAFGQQTNLERHLRKHREKTQCSASKVSVHHQDIEHFSCTSKMWKTDCESR